MKAALYLLVLAALAVPAIRFLIRVSTDRNTQNGVSNAKFRAHDSTVGGYAEQGREFAREMDEEVAGLPAIEQERTAEEARVGRRETRAGG